MVISCDIQNGKQGDWFIGDILKDIYIYIHPEESRTIDVGLILLDQG